MSSVRVVSLSIVQAVSGMEKIVDYLFIQNILTNRAYLMTENELLEYGKMDIHGNCFSHSTISSIMHCN